MRVSLLIGLMIVLFPAFAWSESEFRVDANPDGRWVKLGEAEQAEVLQKTSLGQLFNQLDATTIWRHASGTLAALGTMDHEPDKSIPGEFDSAIAPVTRMARSAGLFVNDKRLEVWPSKDCFGPGLWIDRERLRLFMRHRESKMTVEVTFIFGRTGGAVAMVITPDGATPAAEFFQGVTIEAAELAFDRNTIDDEIASERARRTTSIIVGSVVVIGFFALAVWFLVGRRQEERYP